MPRRGIAFLETFQPVQVRSVICLQCNDMSMFNSALEKMEHLQKHITHEFGTCHGMSCQEFFVGSPYCNHVTAQVNLNMVDRVHDFLVVENLVAAAILGVDFLRQQGLLLDFRTTPVTVLPPPNAESRTQSNTMDDGHSNLQ